MNYEIKDILKKFFSSRLFVLGVALTLMFSIVLIRVFSLQIINGETYQENFTLRIQKTLSVDASRGNIYDCKGNLLAYNELAYAVTISDSSSYSSNSAKNLALNAELAEVIRVIEENGETITNNFAIDLNEDGTYSFNVSGTALKRFLADAFGKTSYSLLKYNKEFGFNSADATAEQVMQYLMYNKSSGFFTYKNDAEAPKFTKKMEYEIVVIRYAMLQNRYTKYKTTTIAENVSDRTVAYMSEHSDTLTGIEIEEDTIRKYNYSEYFASIIGYTGRITTEEYNTLSQTDSSYTLNDIVGRSGLESYYESYLRGKNGEREVYVDNMGRISEVISSKDPVAGNDLYISIDAELQSAVYQMLEQELSSILYSNIQAGNISIGDVYFALINNNVLDINRFSAEEASEVEKAVYEIFEDRRDQAISEVLSQLYSDKPLVNNNMSEELLDYFTSAFSFLKDEEILLSSKIDTNDSVYTDWRNGRISPQEYLNYCITNQWIDISLLNVDTKYADTAEIYEALCKLMESDLVNYKDFQKSVYKYMVSDGAVTGKQLSLILFEQEIIPYDDETVARLKDGSLTAYKFITEAIKNIEITPAQLALDPCTASSVITDVRTGEVKALVSYPGYDNNRLANTMDVGYWNSLINDLSNPLYNYATQEKTAPGSTFKIVTSTAGLAEGVIDTSTEITCTGKYMDISNTPTCWIYPGNHGSINVSEALRDSCNYYFYSVGMGLSCLESGNYDDPVGISYIQKYARIFGLDQKTGLEIEENTSEIATKYPVMAAIGQSDNNYTTVALARYTTAIATGCLYDYQLMSKIVDKDGNVLASYRPRYEMITDVLPQSDWDAIHYGMRLVCENMSTFDNLGVTIAGKTGTAQQVETRPNHALFVGYAPYEEPQISIATRIAYGYTSHNAADVSRNIMSYYFGEYSLEDILSGNAENASASVENVVTD